MTANRASPVRTRDFVVVLCTVSVCTLLFFLQPQTFDNWRKVASESVEIQEDSIIDDNPWDIQNFVVGPPTVNFRDNLKKNQNYITTWTGAGFTNQFMNYVNMIYLGHLSNRIPIVPVFHPEEHITQSAGLLPFGDVFNLSEFRRATGIPLLEWHDVKQLPPGNVTNEPLGCWSAWYASAPWEGKPRDSRSLVDKLGLDVSYASVPIDSRRTLEKDVRDPYLLFWPLVSLIFPSTENRVAPSSPVLFPSPKGSTLPPDEQLSCFDYLYFLVGGKTDQDSEWDEPYSFPFRFIAKYLHFTDSLQDIARSYIAHAFDFNGSLNELPPHITIHVRRGDFASSCWQVTDPKDCFAPVSVYAQRVKEVQEQLRKDHAIDIPNEHVILTSDEQDPEFWSEVHAQGWRSINHSETLTRYGEWHIVLIDMVIQSLGNGFVGTDKSTVSIVSRKRVEAWNQEGVTRTVRWGRPGADDH